MNIKEPREIDDFTVLELRGMRIRSELNNAISLFERVIKMYSTKGKTGDRLNDILVSLVDIKEKLFKTIILPPTEEGIDRWLKSLYLEYTHLANKARIGK